VDPVRDPDSGTLHPDCDPKVPPKSNRLVPAPRSTLPENFIEIRPSISFKDIL